MVCLENDQAIFIRVLMFFDILTYVLFVCIPSNTKVRIIVTSVLTFNMWSAIILSFSAFTGIQLNVGFQFLGIGLAGAVAIMMMKEFGVIAIKLIVMGMLLVSAQLSSTYVPALLNSKLGIDLTTGASIVLAFPLVIIVLAEIAMKSKFMKIALLCFFISWVCVFAGSVLSQNITYYIFVGDVCCDLKDTCPIYLSNYELVSVFALTILLWIFTLREFINKDKKTKEKEKEESTDDVIHQQQDTEYQVDEETDKNIDIDKQTEGLLDASKKMNTKKFKL